MCTLCQTQGNTSEECLHPRTCVNCGQGHAADDPGCPSRRRYKIPTDKGKGRASRSPSPPPIPSDHAATAEWLLTGRRPPTVTVSDQGSQQGPGAGSSRQVSFAEPNCFAVLDSSTEAADHPMDEELPPIEQ